MVASAAVPAAVDGKPPWDPLYIAVALGMTAYSRCAFRVDTVGPFEPRHGAILVATHRAESDVPIICSSLFWRGKYQLRLGRVPWLWFAARDDMFDRGFFAGFPPGLPLLARRALFPLGIGEWLPRVRVAPVPYPSISKLRLGRALESVPAGTPLAEVLDPDLLAPLVARAHELGLPEPRAAGDVVRGEFADLLWRYCTREELDHPAFAPAWERRAADGAVWIRQLIELQRSSGEMLLLFPEGRPSPDGSIGPLQPGVDLLVRRIRPSLLLPLALAYDPLTPSRPRVVLAVGRAFEPPGRGASDAVVAALRETMPLTAGQVVARNVLDAAKGGRFEIPVGELRASLEAELGAASRTGRPVESALAGGRLGERLTEALVALVRRGLARRRDAWTIELLPDALLRDAAVARLAREFESARELPRG